MICYDCHFFPSSSFFLYKDSNLKSVEELLEDSSRFKNIHVALDENLDSVIKSQKRVTDLLKKPKIN